jgi:hypothetical protein
MILKQLEISQKVYNEFKALDAEILEIEKVAMLVANGDTEVNLSLNVKDTSVKEPKSKVNFDEDGSLMKSGQLGFRVEMFNPFEMYTKHLSGLSQLKEEKQPATTLKSKLSENMSLNILAVLLSIKMEERAKLIRKLNRFGVTI